MPVTVNEANVRHLLRRAEFVDRPPRVSELMALSSIDAVVDNVMDISLTGPELQFTESDSWRKLDELVNFWFDRMANDSRPFRERMALFWHGHLVCGASKVGSPELMHEYLQTLRKKGLGTNTSGAKVKPLVKELSTQVAMLRYLDAGQNRKDSPNQNFARELLELFLLGVGNYSEADVEAATAAWTGHAEDEARTGKYRWVSNWHDGSTKSFLGQTINAGNDETSHGVETIDVVFSSGRVPDGALSPDNVGRATKDVVAEHLSTKLWRDFAGTQPPDGVIDRLATSLVSSGFKIRPWVKTLFTSAEFYASDVRSGLVRPPIDHVVAMLDAVQLPSAVATPLHRLRSAGQRPLFPPDVSGWGTNEHWINPAAVGGRGRVAQHVEWKTIDNYWASGEIRLRYGTLKKSELTAKVGGVPTMSAGELVDTVREALGLRIDDVERDELIRFADTLNTWDRQYMVGVFFSLPSFSMS